MNYRASSVCAFFIGAAIACLGLVEAGMYNEYVTELDPSNFDKLVIDTTETWLVKFYAPWCGHCQSSAPAFSKAAKKLDGVARFGVINCDEHKSLASRFKVQGFPTIKVFKGEGKKARRPSDYNNARTSKAFMDHVKYIMPSFVARVKASGTDAFLKDLTNLPHVLLFTDKSNTSPLYKGISARFKGKLSFGEVRKSEAKGLSDKFTVSSYPTLMIFKAGESDPTNAIAYEGEMNPKGLDKFLSGVASGNTTISTDGGSESAKDEKPKETVFAQPKAYSGAVETILGTEQYEDLCGSRKDGRMCGLAILPKGYEHPFASELKPIAEKYQYDNLAFAVIDSSIEGGSDYAKLFNIPDEGGFLVMRCRKKKYAILESDSRPTVDSVSSFLDRLVGGDARFKKLTTDLPEWKSEVKTETEGSDTESNTDTDANTDANTDNEDSGQCGTEPPKDGESCGAEKEEL